MSLAHETNFSNQFVHDSVSHKLLVMYEVTCFNCVHRIVLFLLQLPRRLSSNANPVRRYPKSLTAVQRKEESEAPSTSVRTDGESYSV